MRDTIHRVAGAMSEGRPDAVVRAIQNSFLVSYLVGVPQWLLGKRRCFCGTSSV